MNCLLVAVSRVFDARYYPSFERVAFLDQLVNTFRVRALDVGQTLEVSGLLARTLSRCLARECQLIQPLAFLPRLRGFRARGLRAHVVPSQLFPLRYGFVLSGFLLR